MAHNSSSLAGPASGAARLDEMNQRALSGGGADRIEKQHQSGKLTAHERVDLLMDPGSFVEIDRFVLHRCTDFDMGKHKVLGDGVVTGFGLVDGRNTKLEDPAGVARQIERMAPKLGQRAYLAPSCGLEYLPRDRAYAKLELLEKIRQAVAA